MCREVDDSRREAMSDAWSGAGASASAGDEGSRRGVLGTPSIALTGGDSSTSSYIDIERVQPIPSMRFVQPSTKTKTKIKD